MKIKHHPGKAVIHDPSWLEMDIPNNTRGRQYEANWLDTQKSLSNTSNKNSWDKYSAKSLEGTLSAKLGPYQTMLQELSLKTDDIYTLPRKFTKDSVRLKYHSQKCLSRINSKSNSDIDEEMKKFYKPNDIKEEEEAVVPPKPKPRTKIVKKSTEDKTPQHRKSVRFDEITTEIPGGFSETSNDSRVRVISNPLDELYEQELMNMYSKDSGVDSDDVCQDRISHWIDEQNQYLEKNEDKFKEKNSRLGSDLYRNDSGFYDTKKVRQRIPPRVYTSTSSSSDFSSPKSSSSSDKLNEDEIFTIYKGSDDSKHKTRKGKNSEGGSDFLIPRPKLIVPVHSYGVRRRRTGNLLSEQAISECDYGDKAVSKNNDVDNNGGTKPHYIENPLWSKNDKEFLHSYIVKNSTRTIENSQLAEVERY
ncbi:hypothetical protein HHI36_014634 [Cryptolaemus montrouzieri]|uniref:Uncharacterized protein n=1 Tax=Cryptolaemus montrouzieri TaxID=559131 RepID=A0ABD2N359_9CUCU